ncbi:MAG TPA: lytic murein transglycosylase [Hyphomicrobiaceae bacterium]|nr:lytic murein transglycosylase [Hyphomicrobiaceae bacterium]
MRASRAGTALGIVVAIAAGLVGTDVGAADEGFRRWVEELWPEAQAQGVKRATFERAFAGVEPDRSLPDLVLPGKKPSEVRGQAEFIRPPQDYLNRNYLARLAQQGRGFMAQYADALAKIEREIGVERHVVLGIWGRETAYGRHKLPYHAITALATQAYLGRRKEMFRAELLAALRMLEEGVIAHENMRGSWAGALGLPQFMPTDYYAYAYDLDGDGKKDIWNSVPDALASAAKQLKDKGWIGGLSWGYEVTLPADLDCASEGPGAERPLGEWVRLGVRRAGGRAFPPEAMGAVAYLMMPGGAYGPAFLVTENFKVIRRYNMSDLYALFVGNLSDRIAGGGDFVTQWRNIKQLSTGDIEEIQERLQRLGYAIDKVDGKIGSVTRRQVGLFQRASRLPVDCWPGLATLDRARASQARP